MHIVRNVHMPCKGVGIALVINIIVSTWGGVGIMERSGSVVRAGSASIISLAIACSCVYLGSRCSMVHSVFRILIICLCRDCRCWVACLAVHPM